MVRGQLSGRLDADGAAAGDDDAAGGGELGAEGGEGGDGGVFGGGGAPEGGFGGGARGDDEGVVGEGGGGVFVGAVDGLEGDLAGGVVDGAGVGLDELEVVVGVEAGGDGLHDGVEGDEVLAGGHAGGGDFEVEVVGGVHHDELVVWRVGQLGDDMAEEVVGDADASERASQDDNVVGCHFFYFLPRWMVCVCSGGSWGIAFYERHVHRKPEARSKYCARIADKQKLRL